MKSQETNNDLPIQRLFEPQAIAVIGASADQQKIGHTILKNILDGGYQGNVYPVNPGGGEILNLPVYARITHIDDQVDVACIVIPAGQVFEAVEDCAAQGVKYLAIIASGFSEAGHGDEERRIVAYAHDHGMRVLGPNIFGFYSAGASLNATFGAGQILPGHVAIISQSGALGIAMIGKTAIENIGLSALVSVGNKSDLDEADLLPYLARHDETHVILLYIESVKDGRNLIEAVQQTTPKKPVIAIKSGRSEKGSTAVASHTGSLAASDEVFGAVMRQFGVLRAETVHEAFGWCKLLDCAPQPQGQNTVIVTNGGGIGVMATDACEKFGVPLYDEAEALEKIFSPALPDFGSTKNPIDLTGQATARAYNDALEAALKQEAIDSVITLYAETAVFDAAGLAAMMKENYHKFQADQKPIIFSVLGGEKTEQSLAEARRAAVPVFAEVYETVSAVGAMYRYWHFLQESPGEAVTAEVDTEQIEALARQAGREERSFLLAPELQQLAEIAALPAPPSRIARAADEAANAAAEIGYPVVLKVISPDILHKSDAGGVILELEHEQAVREAYEQIMQNCQAYDPEADIRGVELSKMVSGGTEVILGARRDEAFGPILLFGLGGIFVEVLKDVSFRATPLNRAEIKKMIAETRAGAVLAGARGQAAGDIETLTQTGLKLATIIQRCPSISEIEINPLLVHEQGQGATAVDLRVLL